MKVVTKDTLKYFWGKVKSYIGTAVSTKQDTLTFDDAPTANSDNPVKSSGVKTAIDSKQDTLVSGMNIKTVNSTSLLGSGDISIPAGATGATGKSAYQSYLDTTSDTTPMTEQEWLVSLKGTDGIDGNDGVGFSSIQTPQTTDGTVIITLTNGNTITLDLNHNHSTYYTKTEINTMIGDIETLLEAI